MSSKSKIESEAKFETEEIRDEIEDNMKIAFKRKLKKRNLRRRSETDDPINEQVDLNTIEEIKEKQKLRQRHNGVSLEELSRGQKKINSDNSVKDAYNILTGGLVNMKNINTSNMNNDDAFDVNIGTQFSAETNKRDEDEEMMKYIEEELRKRKGVVPTTAEEDDEANNISTYITPEEAALMALPEHLRQSTSHRSEEMLSNQMLNGIPEIDLGIQAKIKNIEATEEAKQKLLQDKRNQKDSPSQFVPTNMAVNFMQHNRFNIEESTEPKRFYTKEEKQKNPNYQYGPNGVKRATDDYHYDKFKKQFRRY